jgi:hypothetical protein
VLFVVTISNGQVQEILADTRLNPSDDWSPHGNLIIFSRHVTPGPSFTSVGHVGWLYFAWGYAIGALLYLALRIVNYSPAAPGPEEEPDVSGLPLD